MLLKHAARIFPSDRLLIECDRFHDEWRWPVTSAHCEDELASPKNNLPCSSIASPETFHTLKSKCYLEQLYHKKSLSICCYNGQLVQSI